MFLWRVKKNTENFQWITLASVFRRENRDFAIKYVNIYFAFLFVWLCNFYYFFFGKKTEILSIVFWVIQHRIKKKPIERIWSVGNIWILPEKVWRLWFWQQTWEGNHFDNLPELWSGKKQQYFPYNVHFHPKVSFMMLVPIWNPNK